MKRTYRAAPKSLLLAVFLFTLSTAALQVAALHDEQPSLAGAADARSTAADGPARKLLGAEALDRDMACRPIGAFCFGDFSCCSRRCRSWRCARAPLPSPVGADVVRTLPPISSSGAGWWEPLLSQHNSYRSRHHAPPLRWDSSLAADAQQEADACRTYHVVAGGENKFWATGGTAESVRDQVTPYWYNEVSSYDYSNPGFSMSTGHFTQVVWTESTSIGCGIKECSFGRQVVCRYSPKGNFGYAADYRRCVLRP